MSKNDKNNSCLCPDRLGKVGGQAVLEGVMMKAGDRMVTTCRKDDGSLVVNDDKYVSVRQKHKILDLPLIRGVVSFVESMVMSFRTLGASADALGLEEEEPSKFEKWLSEKLHVNLTDFVMVISLILGLGLSALLFIFLPILITSGIDLILYHAILTYSSMSPVASAIIEGLVKVGIFVGYLAAVSLMPDIKRTFMYHGAEHKSIACFEAGEELTPENAKKHTRFHPRCGTSFMFFMILLGIFVSLLLKTIFPALVEKTVLYTLAKILVLPLIMGIGYEFIRFAGKHPNPITNALSLPGIWMQKITTKEPDEGMLEVAITSLKCALRDDYPEFKEFFEAKPWESKVEETEAPKDAQAEETTEEVSEVVEETSIVEESPIVEEASAVEESTAVVTEENDA